ncbi:double-stranded RNA-binding protein Staufen homolog isoform X2 [Homalodisca vitripennis]|uniref:double-stranded RNA-binding protein Staufen homolog isoform X2 n=1 Tax=Homalodisca vitripennis TaxID=197043 RepID=UPI001EEA82E9|nr:double-stranded RNA-binding protein Staufen homolog isoform X2 [Homalodisca vitripennis]
MTSGQAAMEGAAISVSETELSTHTMSHKGSDDAENVELANLMKEKTPMCLVNELARYNKIQHQYRLTSEQGPAHKKLFTVTLKLGEEEYSAEGASIKKAQHLAASDALKSTAYKHPPPKASRNNRLGKNNITPTVELNALAMKRGEPTVYTFVELPTLTYATHNNYSYHRGVYAQRFYGSKPPSLYKVTVKVGEREFHGEGLTAQAARHDAAAKALEELRNLPLEPSMVDNNLATTVEESQSPANIQETSKKSSQSPAAPAADHLTPSAMASARVAGQLTAQTSRQSEQVTVAPGDLSYSKVVKQSNDADPGVVNIEADSSSELKSPISLVHELALKRNLTVLFDVISEKGPPHMRTFVTRCCVGDNFETMGEGNGKKISKKRAAEKMLDQLKLLPPTTTVTAANCAGAIRMKRKSNPAKKKSRNLIKVTCSNSNKENNSENTETVDEINPISRLMQIQQAKKEKEPIYTLMEERGQTRRREFFMEVTVGEHSFVGSGPNKKIAKRNAAEGLLQKLGYSSVTPGKPRLTSAEVNRKVFVEAENTMKVSVGGSGGRQLVPGLLLMSDNHVTTGKNNGYPPQHNTRVAPKGHSVNIQATAAMAKEYLNGTNPMSVDAMNDGKSTPAVRPKDQLLYLAQLLGFRVQFSDFPKGNHSEFLSLVSLSTDPPQVCHGSGLTTELSHDQAALTALRALSEMGLDSVTPMKKEPASISSNNDGMYTAKGNAVIKTNYVNGGHPNK